MKSRRALGTTPSEDDLALVVFSHANRFQADERVLVPRSRGGFVYGKIVHGKKRNTCYVDANVSHTLIDWRVEYPNADGRTMFKQQPCALVGKFPADSSAPPAPLSASQTRQLGAMASLRDLSNVLFTPLSKFEVGETVLVARSSGGFTYGELIADMPVLCLAPLEREGRHRVKGWRVALDEKKSMKKELPTVLIGKIPLCGAISEVIPAPYESVAAPAKKKRGRKPRGPPRKGGRGKRSRRPDRTPTLTPAAPIGVLNPAEDEAAEESSEEEDDFEFDEEEEEEEEEDEEEDFDDEDEEEEEEEEDEDSEVILFRPPGADQDSAGEKPRVHEEEDSDSEEILVQARPGNGGILQIPGAMGAVQPPKPAKQTHPAPAQPAPARIIPPAAQAPARRPPGSGKLMVPVNAGLKCLVVIDAPNVAMKHGNRTFSTKGILLCVQYYKQRGHEVVAFLPEHYVNGKKTPGANGVTISDYYNPKVDDMNIINQLVRDEILFFTPPQDYDDSYCIEYAKQNGGIIVTNDMYRDHINQFNEPQRGRVKRWIREHVCSFTFVKDTFMPNPDFKLP